MADLEQVGGACVAWDAEAAEAFSSRHLAPSDDPTMPDDFYARGVASGELLLIRWQLGDGSTLAHTALRRETTDGKSEMVIVGAASARPELPAMETILPLLEDFARAWKCCSIRWHTERNGLVKKGQAAGYRVSELVMRKVLDG
ncbi:hypothetical protein [Pyruvatibacter mobilis]|uniref:hypothetical protein n=1 Tax=Pyruvatibacter mobilis TaxID=1712261 RepID=UPI003BABA118